MSKYLPQALGATGLVVAGPVVAVWALRAWQVVGSTTLAVAIGVILSLAVSFGGSTYWANRDSSRDVLFSELMIWGWLRRWRAEHKLTAALEHLAEVTAAGVARDGTPQLAMLTELAEALEAGDPYTRNHSRRVARYASMIADRLGLAADEVDRIRTAAMVHDVGKVRTPIEVLHKPGKLTDEEYAIIKEHPVDGAHLVEALGDDRLTAIVRHHHERLDGRGYPDGLKGEEIPLGARIVAVADTFDAITSARAYRPASPHRKALDILIKEAGTQLDADAVRAFRACYTGRRPFGVWMTVLAFPQRISTTLGNGATASAASLPKVVMAASTVAVVGGAAASAHPLMVVPVASQATAAATATVTVAAAAASRTPAAPAPAQRPPSVEPALGAKLASPSVRTREHSMLRRPGNLSHRFPTSPLVAHRVARSSSRTSASPVTPAPSSAPVSTPAPSSAPVSSTTSSAPVSTVAAAPTATPAPTSAPSTKGSGAGKGSTRSSTKDHGQGSGGEGQGKGQGHGADTTKTKTTTAPTTTTPGKGNGKGNGNADGTGKGNGNAGGNGNGNGTATTGAGGNGHGNGNGGATNSAGGNGDGTAAGTGSGTAGGTGDAGANGNGNGKGATTTTTGAGNGNGNGTSNAGGNGNGSAGTTGNGHPHVAR